MNREEHEVHRDSFGRSFGLMTFTLLSYILKFESFGQANSRRKMKFRILGCRIIIKKVKDGLNDMEKEDKRKCRIKGTNNNEKCAKKDLDVTAERKAAKRGKK